MGSERGCCPGGGCSPLDPLGIGASADSARLRSGVLLAEAAATADDPRAKSYALGYRGAPDERAGLLSDARVLTRRALLAADRAGAPDALYRWLWQLGRIERRELIVGTDSGLVLYHSAIDAETLDRDVHEFYSKLAAGVSRAAALQAAQVELLRGDFFRYPVDWSPFLLISSWL